MKVHVANGEIIGSAVYRRRRHRWYLRVFLEYVSDAIRRSGEWVRFNSGPTSFSSRHMSTCKWLCSKSEAKASCIGVL